MTTLALHQPTGGDVRRYGAAAIAILLLHAVVIAALITWLDRPAPHSDVTPTILIDLSPPASAAPEVPTQQDIAPGPPIEEAEPPPPEPPKPESIEQLPPAPVQPEPTVVTPPKVEPKPEPKPVKPQPVREQVKKPTKRPFAPRTTAPQQAERVAPETQSASSGKSAAGAKAEYNAILIAHLRRFKQSPGSDDVGSVLIRFTVARSGRVISSGLGRSSGFPALDRAALDLLQRAQPLPAFPPEMRQSSEPYEVPVAYGRR